MLDKKLCFWCKRTLGWCHRVKKKLGIIYCHEIIEWLAIEEDNLRLYLE